MAPDNTKRAGGPGEPKLEFSGGLRGSNKRALFWRGISKKKTNKKVGVQICGIFSRVEGFKQKSPLLEGY